MAPRSRVCVLTLGRKPQVVTLLLDALYARGEHISEVIVVHLALTDLRNQLSYQHLSDEFREERYDDHPCHFTHRLVTLLHRPVDALNNEDALDAVRDHFDDLFAELKRRDCQIHLGVSGGPRLMGQIATGVAHHHFQNIDRIWHLHSTDEVIEQTKDGNCLHLPTLQGIRLLRVPLQTRPLNEEQRFLDKERQQCQLVYDHLSEPQQHILRQYVSGKSTTQIAQQLGYVRPTVDNHKTHIFRECEKVWPEDPFTSSMLVHKFRHFF